MGPSTLTALIPGNSLRSSGGGLPPPLPLHPGPTPLPPTHPVDYPWTTRGRPVDPRVELKRRSVFGPVFEPISDAILVPFWLHFGTQNRKKTQDFDTCFLDRFRVTFFLYLGAPSRPPTPQNHSFPYVKQGFLKCRHFASGAPPGSKLKLFGDPNGSQMSPKPDQKTIEKRHRF